VPGTNSAAKGRVLLVDDQADILRAYARWLTAAGFQVETADDGSTAADMAAKSSYDVIISDISMPGMTGVEMLRAVRERDLDVPVVLMTAQPAIESAMEAVELGALRYLPKPVDGQLLVSVADNAVRLHKLARLKREALSLTGSDAQPGDRVALEGAFERALAGLWLAFQPIVSLSEKRIFAYEALMRSREAALPHPGAMLSAAERLDRLPDLGRAIRARAAAAAAAMPNQDVLLFINLHPADFQDPTLFSEAVPLAAHAHRVVLEVTERSALDDIHNIRDKVGRLRAIGYRIAVDDLGAGYAGLSTFANLEPEVVKIDMSLVRDVETTRTKRTLVASLTGVCRDLGMKVVAEGVETAGERDALTELGCDLLQGYFFARPAADFPPVVF
jgi:EAL domain-containing protein (putative c-di-GMP-specific phosphodiesterase class I)/ActR/RegA family two-component response regulator